MTIVRKIPWTRQPPPGTPIDWGNPITRGLDMAYALNGHLQNLVDGSFASFNHSDGEFGPSTEGISYKNLSRATGDYINVGDSGRDYNVGEWSFFFLATLTGNYTATDEHGLLGSVLNQLGDYNEIVYSTSVPEDGQPHTYGISLVTGDCRLFFDGAQRGNVVSTDLGPSATLRYDANAEAIEFYIGGGTTGNTSFFGAQGGGGTYTDAWEGYGHIALRWNRWLSPAEHASLADNPWQIFQPRTQIIPTFVPAAQTYGVVPRKIPWTRQPTTRTQLDYSHPFKPIQAIVPGWDHVKDAAGQVNSVGKQRLIYSAVANGSVDAGTHLDVKAESYKRWGSFNCWHHDFVSGDAGAGYILERSEPGDTGIQFADTNNFCVVGIYRPKGDGTVGSSDPRIYSKDEGAFEPDHDLMIGTTAGTGGERPRCRIRIGSSTITSAVSAGNIVDNDSWNIILGGVEPHPTAGDVNVITKCIKESNGTVVPNYKSSIQQTGTYNPRTTTSEALFGNAEATTNELDGRILGVFFFDKMLSDEELAAFFQNPWQIFQPQTQYLPTAFDTPTETFGYIPRKVPWTRQPPGGVQINKGNPLTRGLVSAITPAGGSWYDIVANRHGSLQSGATVSAGPLGRWTDFDGSDDAVDMGGDYTDVVDLESNNGQWTALTLIDHDASNGNLWGIRDASVTAQLYTDAGTGGAGSELNYRALSTVNILSAGNLSSGYHTVAVSRDGSTIVKGYIDGIDDGGSGSRVPGNPDTPTANLQLGNHEGSYPYNGAIYLQAFWSRVLSDSEHAELAANPWQIFKPQTQYIPVSFGAAAPPPGDDIIIQIPVWWR